MDSKADDFNKGSDGIQTALLEDADQFEEYGIRKDAVEPSNKAVARRNSDEKRGDQLWTTSQGRNVELSF